MKGCEESSITGATEYEGTYRDNREKERTEGASFTVGENRLYCSRGTANIKRRVRNADHPQGASGMYERGREGGGGTY